MADRPRPIPGFPRTHLDPRREPETEPGTEARPALRPPPEPAEPQAAPAPPPPVPAPVRVERGTSSSEFERREKARTQTILAVAGLVTALFGGAGIGSVYQRDREGLTREQAQAIRDDIKSVAADVREIREHLRQANAGELERWDITTGILCRLNGGTRFARGVNCDAVARWDGPPNDSTVGWKAQADWVPVRRPP